MTTLSTSTPTPDSELPVTIIGAGERTHSLAEQVRSIWDRRDLVSSLTRREVTSRHKSSVLGLAWNLLNPLLQMVVYTIVFTYFMPGRIPFFPLKLLSAMAIFGLFSTALTSAATSITGNSSLVLKIWFPREILALSAVGSSLVIFASRIFIVAVGSIIYRHPPAWELMGLALYATAIALVLAYGLGLLLATANVYFRDTQHFLELTLMALFWFTPVIWSYDYVAGAAINRFGAAGEWLLLINPLIIVTTAFQRVFYNPAGLPADQQGEFALMLRPVSWYLTHLTGAAIIAVLALLLGLRVFRRFEGGFAEAL